MREDERVQKSARERGERGREDERVCGRERWREDEREIPCKR